jgi:hypothetical protein
MLDTVLKSTGHDAFDPDRHWPNGFMGVLKMNTDPEIEKWPTSCGVWSMLYVSRGDSMSAQ